MGIFRGREGEPPGEPRLLIGYAALTHQKAFPHAGPLPGGEGMAGREGIHGGADILSAQIYSCRQDACITIKESQAGRLHYNKGEENAFPSMP